MDRRARMMIDAGFATAAKHGWIINQSPGELAEAALEIEATHPCRTVLEIGAQHGGWMLAVHPACEHGVRYIAVDPAFSTGWPIYSGLLREAGVEVVEIRRASQAAFVSVELALCGGADGVDVLHIDGDHVAAAALSDYLMYSPLVRPGGLILMHDVCGSQGPGSALAGILAVAERIAESIVVCDTWQNPPEARMGICMLRLK